MSSEAGDAEFSRWKSRESRRPRNRNWSCTPVRTACLRLILVMFLSMAGAAGAHADAFADGARAYARQYYPLSARIFLSLAEQGDPRAQTYIGVMYLRGQGVPQNFDAAAYWLHLASETGLPTAQYFLGLMYDKGQGVAQDFVLAHAWLNIAVAHAEPKLRRRWVLIRDAIASKMSEAQLAEARRLAYEWRPDPPR